MRASKMPINPTYPGVYVEEIPSAVRTINGVNTSLTAFIGNALKGPKNKATLLQSFPEFRHLFGELCKESSMGYAVYQYFLNGGMEAVIVRVDEDSPDSNIIGDSDAKTGFYALDSVPNFNLLCIPPPFVDDETTPGNVYTKALDYCKKRRAILIVDPPKKWTQKDDPIDPNIGIDSDNFEPKRDPNAAIFFPRIIAPDPRNKNRLREFVPCGAVAGAIARIDNRRGVWKSPAGIEATLEGVSDLTVQLTDEENAKLNSLGINCLRLKEGYGTVVWGAQTMCGEDQLGSQWKYLSVRRTALYIEESLYQGTRWAIFEPNNEQLWARIRFNAGAFMHDLFREGAFQGSTPKEAYFVKCDKDTTTKNDVGRGIFNIVVGFAPLKPAEFIILKIQQFAGQ